MKILLFVAIAFFLVGCGASQPAQPEPETETEKPTGGVSASDYGEDWPFTVDEGQINCLPGDAVVFNAGETSYPLNGNAKDIAATWDLQPLENIWKDNGMGGKMDIQPFISIGLQRCGS